MVVRMCIALGELSLVVFYLWMLPVTGCCPFFAACTVAIKGLCLLMYLVFTIRQHKIPTETAESPNPISVELENAGIGVFFGAPIDFCNV